MIKIKPIPSGRTKIRIVTDLHKYCVHYLNNKTISKYGTSHMVLCNKSHKKKCYVCNNLVGKIYTKSLQRWMVGCFKSRVSPLAKPRSINTNDIFIITFGKLFCLKLGDLVVDPNWGDPTQYDIVVDRSSSIVRNQFTDLYALIPRPKLKMNYSFNKIQIEKDIKKKIRNLKTFEQREDSKELKFAMLLA